MEDSQKEEEHICSWERYSCAVTTDEEMRRDSEHLVSETEQAIEANKEMLSETLFNMKQAWDDVRDVRGKESDLK